MNPSPNTIATDKAVHTISTEAPLHTDELPTTLVEMFERALRVHDKPDALNYKRDGAWRSITSQDFLTRIKAVALSLEAYGVKRGDRVAIFSENCPEWTLTDAGALFAGAVDVPIYPTQAPAQVRYILDDSEARILFVQNAQAYARVAEHIRDCASLQHIVFFHEESTDEPKAVTFAELERRGRELAAAQPALLENLRRNAPAPDDLATIIYTSGTTGEPKGVMLTHANLTTNLIDSSGQLGFSKGDVVLSVLPLSHVFERLGMYMYIDHGMSVFYAESLDKIGDNMREVRPTIMLCVPRLFEKIYARIKERAAEAGGVKRTLLEWAVETGKRWAKLKLQRENIPALLQLQYNVASRVVFSKWREGVGGRVRLLVSGGAALPDEIALIFFGAGLPIVQGYGLTETSPVIAAGSLEENRVGTVGQTIPNVEVRIAEDGEIETRGPNVMRGYYNKPAETEAVFTPDGWFRTGDIGTLDAEGFLRITDRKKELFKTSGGKYLSPLSIEACIKRSRFVNQVVLVGNGRRFPAALIVPDWEQLRAYAKLKGLDIKTPAEFCKHPRIINLFERQVNGKCDGLARFEQVKRIALLERELTIEGGELTPTMKVKRRVVDEKYHDVIEELYKT
ncbi:MAG: long-chain fatty acid--CoA ligase [Pyrinomonadaceae bacterium]|nr:long-chain fatty acid--CoA ligase [Pyrinomonadaceae bacterium]